MASKTVLMVEGKDDCHVVSHICGTRRLGRIDDIRSYEGKDNLLDSIGTRLKESDLTSLGVLLDADTDLAARWQAVAERLRRAGYQNVPVVPDVLGTVLDSPPRTLLPRVGVWLMPNNKLSGILEDFLAFLVDPADQLFQHVENCMRTIPEGERRFDVLNAPKAKIHTWLAWQAEPGRPLGQAVSLRYLDPHSPNADVFSDWLNRTFFAGAQSLGSN